MDNKRRVTRVMGLALFLAFPAAVLAGEGTQGAAFLEIPVGGRPAAMGGAYGALATDAYAPVWNPAGLGFLQGSQLATMHLSYLEGISYEFAGLGLKLGESSGLGLAVQYFHAGSITGTDASGNPTSGFSANYGAYTVSYGAALSKKLALGASVRLIQARIASASASAWVGDVGTLFRASEEVQLSLVLNQAGGGLKMVQQTDKPPTAVRAGAAWSPSERMVLAGELRFPRGSKAGGAGALEYRVAKAAALRVGYGTALASDLEAPAGLTAGLGVRLWGQDFDYAWVPYGELGQAQYISVLFRFGSHGGAPLARGSRFRDMGGWNRGPVYVSPDSNYVSP